MISKGEVSLFDVCIVGGGMVGAAMALGLQKLGFQIAIIEPNMPKEFSPDQAPDMRVSAISLSSEKLLTQLGAWQFIQQMRICPYKRLSVWDKPSCRTNFDCAAINQPHLGHIVENRVIQLGLHQALNMQDNVTLFESQNIQSIVIEHLATISFENGDDIQAKMLIGADGAQSIVRKSMNIGVQGWQYAQQALGIQIKTVAEQQDITWQQFTANGPLAFLPLYDGYASLVWYNHAADIQHLKTLSKNKLKQHILQHFPSDLVDFEVLELASFPLTRMHANHYFKGNSVLIGDAAHTINPLAGQGVNLGFKDVAALLDVITKELTTHSKETLLVQAHSNRWLKNYEKARRTDNLLMMSVMDGLYATFSNHHLPLKIMRNLGLKLAEHSGPLKNQAIKYAMGLA